MPTVILHQWEISPFCGKVRKVLHHKGIDFTVVNYNGRFALKAKRLTRVGKLPVLDFDDERVQDSTAIVAYLERRVPQPSLVPADPGHRALACLLEDWADESLFWYAAALRMTDGGAWSKAVGLLCEGRPRWERVPFGMLGKRMYRHKLIAQGLGKLPAYRVREQLVTHLSSLDSLLADHPWLVGSSISIADIAVSAQLDEIVRTSAEASGVSHYPRIGEWLARCA